MLVGVVLVGVGLVGLVGLGGLGLNQGNGHGLTCLPSFWQHHPLGRLEVGWGLGGVGIVLIQMHHKIILLTGVKQLCATFLSLILSSFETCETCKHFFQHCCHFKLHWYLF